MSSLYSDYLQYAPTFRWGGRSWGVNDLGAFKKKIGAKRYDKWARQHPIAAKSFDPVEGQIYSAVQPEITAIEAERKRRADYYARLMQNQAGFTTALMSQLGQIAPAIGGAYSEAARTMGAAGTGYGAVLNNTTAAAAQAANEVLGTINAPQGQMVKGGDAGGVLAGLAGWIPQTLLNQQGGAYAAAASQLPRQASTEAQINMKSILDKAAEEEQGYHDQMTELLQKLPGLRMEAKQKAQQTALQNRQQALRELEAKRSWYMDQAKLAIVMGDKKRANDYLAIAQKNQQMQIWESQGRDAYGNVAPGYHIDPVTHTVTQNGWKWKNGVPVKVSGPKGGGKGSTSSTVPGTPAYNAKAVKAVGDARAKINKDIKAMGKKQEAPPFKTVYPSWEQAYKQLWQQYQYLTGTNSKLKQQLDKVIRNALSAAGIKPAGAGKPKGSKGKTTTVTRNGRTVTVTSRGGP